MSGPPPLPAERSARLAGTIAIVVGLLVAFLFPASAVSGTETPGARWLTAGALVAAGVMLHLGRGRWIVLALSALPLLVAAAVSSAIWPIVLVAAFGALPWVYVLLFRDRGGAETATPADGEAPSDIVESVAIAFVLALVVREFSCEAFKIPTGSMEPTIYGLGYGRRKFGDQLLAAKAPLLLAEPKRWSIVVFRYPLFRPTNFIKRLIGLPGEHLEIRDGDIYANGKVVAKPDEVQETLWFPVLPHEDGEWPAGGAGEAFRPDAAGEWRFDGDGATGTAAADKTSWIVHDTGIPDTRVSFDVDPSRLGDGAVLVRLDGGGRRVELEARRDGMWLSAPGVAGSGSDGDGPGAARKKLDVGGLGTSASRLSISVADRVVRIARDGRQVARIETADEMNLPAKRDQTWIGVAGGTARLTGIRVERDLQYSQRGPGHWDVPQGCYFMLGDNTGASRDSREWQGKVFRTKDGAEIVCDESSIRLDDDTTVPSTRTTPDGNAFEVWDSYGVHRFLAKADLEGGTYKLEPRPFVRREDLIGRAFLIFFPLRSEGTWRPRILP